MSGRTLTWSTLVLVLTLAVAPATADTDDDSVQERAYRQLPDSCRIPVLPGPGFECRIDCDPTRCLFVKDGATQARVTLDDATDMLVLFKVAYHDGNKERDIVCQGSCDVPVTATTGHLFVTISPAAFTVDDYASLGLDALTAPHATAGIMTVAFA